MVAESFVVNLAFLRARSRDVYGPAVPASYMYILTVQSTVVQSGSYTTNVDGRSAEKASQQWLAGLISFDLCTHLRSLSDHMLQDNIIMISLH